MSEALQTAIKSELDILYTELNENLTEHLKAQYTDKVYKTAYEIARGTGIGTNIMELRGLAVSTAIKNAWCSDGKNFSARIWGDNNRLYTALNNILRTSVIQGRSYKETAGDIAKQLKVSKSNAMRLVRTESAYISSVAELETLKALDVEYYQISITLDDRTSETCQELSDKVFKVADYSIGDTTPPFHPNCRSTTIPYYNYDVQGSRSARDKDGRTIWVDKNTTYEEWADTYIKNENKNSDVHNLEVLSHDFYKNYKTLSNQVIITNNQIQHIIERRGAEFYEAIRGDFMRILNTPDYIFEDEKHINTFLVCKEILTNNKSVCLVLKLIVPEDDKDYKNSIITAYPIKESKLNKWCLTKNTLYKNE